MDVITVTEANIAVVQAGGTTIVEGDGKDYLVSPELVQHAVKEFNAGDEVMVLAEVVDGGVMEEIWIKR